MMQLELILFSIIIIAYGIIITLAIVGINYLNISRTNNSKLLEPPFISIILSFRNESNNAHAFINEIIKQSYNKDFFELILVDDFSDDNSYEIFESTLKQTDLKFTLIKQTQHRGKKHNLAQAIEIANGTIIVTTDADVNFRHKNWLSTIATYFENNKPNALVMPIDFEEPKNIISLFQVTENLALTGITAGFCGINKPFLCNGANFAFLKEAYQKVGGYLSHISISSGEDVFLLEDLKKIDASKIHYGFNNELIVNTKAIETIPEFLNQRLRWAGKSKYNSNLFSQTFGFIIIVANLLFLTIGVSYIKNLPITPYLSIFALTKLIFDFLLLFLASKFLGKTKYLWFIIPFECVYWLYAIIVGIGSMFIKPTWKGIKVK